MKRNLITALLIALTFVPIATSRNAAGQTYPNKPIRLVVGFAAGGVTDTMARLVARGLSERLHQQVYVENRPGANGIIAADIVAKAEPDGYTLLMGEIGPNAINVSLYSKLPYDAKKDFVPISRLTSVTGVLVASERSGIKSAHEFIRIAKENPERLTYSSAGVGHSTHVSMEAIKLKNDLSITHVPYKGGAPALQDVVANIVDLNIASISTAKGFIQEGRVRPIAIAAIKRHSSLPGIPTFAEAGFTEIAVDGWHGLFSPKGTPSHIVDLLNREANEVLRMPDVQEAMKAVGVEAIGGTREEFRLFVLSQIDAWGAVVGRLGIKIE